MNELLEWNTFVSQPLTVLHMGQWHGWSSQPCKGPVEPFQVGGMELYGSEGAPFLPRMTNPLPSSYATYKGYILVLWVGRKCQRGSVNLRILTRSVSSFHP